MLRLNKGMKANLISFNHSLFERPENGTCPGVSRRQFLGQSLVLAGGCAWCLAGGNLQAAFPEAKKNVLVSPGCRKSKVRVAKIYLGIPNAHWPTPKMDINEEMRRYESEFARQQPDFADVDFVLNELITKKEQIGNLREQLKGVDGILVIHLSMGVTDALRELLANRKPTMLFAAPYSGHEWTAFGALRREEAGTLLDCMLTSDFNQLAAAVRPFRAIHHLREATILNVSTRAPSADYQKAIAEKYGTQIKTIGRQRMLDAYESIAQADAEAETDRWVKHADKVVEPPRQEIFRSCRLALAFEKLIDEEQATVITVDCYGSMYRQLPAFPCVGFVRLNSMGFGGICESDLTSAMTFILLQGLSGRPGFISDPTMDESVGGIVLAHCLGTIKMDGPDKEPAPYRLRTIMERQEGCVPQVFMRVGQKTTQALLVGTEHVRYFTGDIIAAPDVDRGCRTKITVKVDGDPEKLWQNWSHGLHRVTCYGDLTPDLKRFCRFKGLKLVNEA
jgi:hypothetical protein